jgi:hypothetical protein
METDSRFAHACPDLDQEMHDTPVRTPFLEACERGEFAEPDMINHPPHYNQCGIEAIDVIEAYANDNYHRGAALKYLLRADYKGASWKTFAKPSGTSKGKSTACENLPNGLLKARCCPCRS